MVGLQACTAIEQDCGQLPQDLAAGNAGCLITRPGAVVMVQQQLSGTWAIPGGTAEPGERAACTAARETAEETGFKVNVVEPLVVLDNGFHIYRCDVDPNTEPHRIDALEIRDVQWKSALERAQIEWRFPQYQEVTEALIQRYE